MKIILSRKGFDSSLGGVASPILPDGTLLSLPIPSQHSPITYDELYIDGQPVAPLVERLTNGRIRAGDGAHLDPDLRESTYRRLPGWRPLFGQDGTAQSHLANSGVGVGDLFLFFGWFRQTERAKDAYRFVKGAPDLHVLFGWLQISAIIPADQCQPNTPEWAMYHPHFHGDSEGNNTIYVARETLLWPGFPDDVAGGGVFESYGARLCLTAPGHNRSRWRLPQWFFPKDGRRPLTYHANADRWTLAEDHTILQSVARGQEFVLDVEDYPEAIEWVSNLISGGASARPPRQSKASTFTSSRPSMLSTEG
jgi:hypothetical protein